MDRPEQAVEMVREAVIAAGYAHDSDVSIALRCSPADVYDKVSLRLKWILLEKK